LRTLESAEAVSVLVWFALRKQTLRPPCAKSGDGQPQ
jgi:hypothetical protein